MRDPKFWVQSSEHLSSYPSSILKPPEARYASPTTKNVGPAIGAEVLRTHTRYEGQRLTVFGGYVTVALV